jgi:hypothetical protein
MSLLLAFLLINGPRTPGIKGPVEWCDAKLWSLDHPFDTIGALFGSHYLGDALAIPRCDLVL